MLPSKTCCSFWLSGLVGAFSALPHRRPPCLLSYPSGAACIAGSGSGWAAGARTASFAGLLGPGHRTLTGLLVHCNPEYTFGTVSGAEWHALENRWCARVKTAAADYDKAKRSFWLAEQDSSGLDSHLALRQALRVERMARERYRLELRIFTDLVLRRKLPPKE